MSGEDKTRAPAVGDRVRYTLERDMKGKVLDICKGKDGAMAQVEFDMGETYWIDPDDLEVVAP